MMQRTTSLFSVQVILLSVMLTGCSKKATDEIDFGTFTKSVYTNSYFAVTVTVPANWSIQDQEARERLMKVGAEAVSGEDKNLKAVMKASEMQSVNLFGAFEKPLGAPVTSNPSIMGIAEQVRQLPGIQRGKDYHFQVRKTLEASQMQVKFPKEGYSERLGNVEFDVLEQELSVRGLTIRQKYYTIIKKGYALSFIVSFTTSEEETVLRKALETVAFH
jgi:hypothetical protein